MLDNLEKLKIFQFYYNLVKLKVVGQIRKIEKFEVSNNLKTLRNLKYFEYNKI